jgi:hypothetical protein
MGTAPDTITVSDFVRTGTNWPLSSASGEDDVEALVDLLDGWRIPEGREQAVLDMALASLDQVKRSSEYDDARALLMIVAFLTALAGAVFNRFSSTYGVPAGREILSHWAYVWPALTYAMFGAYAVIVSLSAFVIFGAMKPAFFERRRGPSTARALHSFGFHARILGSDPRTWGLSFVDLAGEASAPRDELKAQYAKHYILESYLVARRIALKLRKAAPAVRWLQLSMLFLAGFILSYGISLLAIDGSAPRFGAWS